LIGGTQVRAEEVTLDRETSAGNSGYAWWKSAKRHRHREVNYPLILVLRCVLDEQVGGLKYPIKREARGSA
jgi:hypothetical protein